MIEATNKQRILEVCVDSVAGLDAAIAGGADRIELCSALSIGGLTPSRGFMEKAARATIPVHALIRPRTGGFHYSKNEVDVMKADISAARHAGLAGAVIGASTVDDALDQATLAELMETAGDMDITLHRVFDTLREPLAALEVAVSLGFNRILTSGGATSALAGIGQLEALANAAAGRISIMPGGGITPENVTPILKRLRVRELHASCSVARPTADGRLVALGFAAPAERTTESEIVAALKAAMVH